MISATIIGTDRVSERLDRLAPNITQSVAAGVQKLLYVLEGRIKTEKLSGQALHVRTDRLRSSVHAEAVKVTVDTISGIVGTNTKYAAYHEYGFTGPEHVKQHLRMIKQAFGVQLKQPKEILIHGYMRQVNYPAHSFMRSQLAEDTPSIREGIRLAVSEGAKL